MMKMSVLCYYCRSEAVPCDCGLIQPHSQYVSPATPKTRFVPQEDAAKLVNLYHLARTALCTEPLDRQTPYDRMLWASKEYARQNSNVSAGGAYKDLCDLLDRN